jgi:hypothetical protein
VQLFNRAHLDLTGGVEHGVQPGVDDPGIVLIDAVEDFQPVLAELPGTEKVVFLIFFFGGLLFFRALIETSALGCRQQSVNLTL